MVLIAGSAGAVVYLYLGFAFVEAAIVALAILTVLGVYNSFAGRLNDRTTVSTQLADLSRSGSDMARQVAEMGRRLAALEAQIETTLDHTRTVTDPLAVEVGELGALVQHLAETVAAHEIAIAGARNSAHAPVNAAPAGLTADSSVEEIEVPVAAAPPQQATPAPEQSRVDKMQAEKLALIRSAIAANRIDLYLQPIVTLPQRKVRYYEAVSRIRTERGDVVQAADFIAQAESGGLMPQIDNLLILRCVQVVRRLLLKNRDIGLFCNISGATLTDASFFPQFLEFMDANRAIAPSLVLEFTQGTLRAMGPIENESLSALSERGFRFSLDNVTDLRFEPRELAARGFRFVKIPAELLLNHGDIRSDIHQADLSDLFGRFGIDLIAEKIESEGKVVDLLDYEVRFGQGFLFSPPRPVRAEALQGVPERSDVIARDLPVEAAGAMAPMLSGRSGASAEPSGNKEPARSGPTPQLRGRATGPV
jgi:cyclic-di-GMP phosphodiesterase TipF (flagellum assembly factor)